MGSDRRLRGGAVSLIAASLIAAACSVGERPELSDIPVPTPAPAITVEAVPATTAPVAQPITIGFGGDVALVDGLVDEDPFAGVTALFQSVDLMTINLETTVTEPDVGRIPVDKPFLFRSPPESVGLLTAAGVDVAGLANNHIWDYGKFGTIRTVELLDEGGLAHVGAGEGANQAYTPLFVDVAGTKVGVASLSRVPCNWSFGGDTSRPQVAWACDPFSEQADALIREIVAESDVSIVMVHWGEEYAPCPEQDRRELATRWASLGVDIIVGAHPHVLQGIERIDNTWVVYSMGNLVLPTARGEDRTTSAIFTFSTADDQLRVVPLRLDERGRPRPAEGDEVASIANRLTERSFGYAVFGDGSVIPSSDGSRCSEPSSS